MDTDLALVIGIFVLVVSLPSVFSAVVARRTPLVGVLASFIGLALLAYAVSLGEGKYTITEVPNVFLRVFNTYIF